MSFPALFARASRNSQPLQHPFAAGATLAGFTAVSVNDQWLPAFIDSTAGIIHKVRDIHSHISSHVINFGVSWRSWSLSQSISTQMLPVWPVCLIKNSSTSSGNW